VFDSIDGKVPCATCRASIRFSSTRTREGEERFNQGAGRTSLYVVVDDPDALHDRAKEAGRRSSAS